MPKLLKMNNFSSDIEYVRAQLSKPKLSFSVRRMWEQRLKSLEQQAAQEQDALSPHASVALIFNGKPVREDYAIDLDFSTKALDSFQDLVSNVHAETVAAHVAGRGPVRARTKSKLFIEDVVHGSMGFILSEEKKDQAEAFQTPLSESLERSLALIEQVNSPDQEQFYHALENSSPRSISALRSLTELLHRSEALVSISSNETIVALSNIDVDRMYLRLHDAVHEEAGFQIRGELKGIFPMEDKFEFASEDGEQIIHGRASRDIVDRYLSDGEFRQAFITTPIVAQFKVTTISRPGHEDSVSHFLEAVRPASPKTADRSAELIG